MMDKKRIEEIALEVAHKMSADPKYSRFANREEWAQYHTDFANALIARLHAEVVPVAWADDYALHGLVGNCASSAAKEYWKSSNWADRAMAKKLKHPLYSIPNAEAVPDGWQLVPKVATPEMLNDMNCATHVLNDLRSARAYEAAISAAPQPPITAQSADERDAERYRFLRDTRDLTDELITAFRLLDSWETPSDEIDAAIDAAIAAHKEQS